MYIVTKKCIYYRIRARKCVCRNPSEDVYTQKYLQFSSIKIWIHDWKLPKFSACGGRTSKTILKLFVIRKTRQIHKCNCVFASYLNVKKRRRPPPEAKIFWEVKNVYSSHPLKSTGRLKWFGVFFLKTVELSGWST